MEVVGRPRMMELAAMMVRVPDYVLDDGGGAISNSASRSSSGGSNGAFFARRRGPSYFSSSFSGSGGGGPDPASSETMAALLRRVVLPAEGTEKTREQCCAVCLDDLDGVGELAAIRSMPCSHSFHEGCIFRWLAVSRVCPCCRFPLPSGADDQPAAAAAGVGTGRRTD